MRRDLRDRLSQLTHLQTLAAFPAKMWRALSLILTGGGVVLLGVGGWMFYEQYRDLIEPPPARIIEVSVADLATDTPAAPVEPTEVKPTGEGTKITFASVTPPSPAATATPSPTRTPRSTGAVTTAAQASPSATREVTPATSTPEATPSPTTPPTVSLSLADNPLPMVQAETVTPEPTVETQAPEAAPQPAGVISRVVAESIELDSEVIEVGWQTVIQNGATMNVWAVADYAAGWHNNSALPGQGGNVVLSGHHNINGEVFRYIVDMEPGAIITLYAGDQSYDYVVEDKFIVKDKDEPEAIRRENAKWIGPFNEERLTLVTCWPYTNNTHRVIVIAKPAPQD